MNTRTNLGLGLLLLVLLLSNSVYVVDQRAVAVLLEFEQYQSAVTAPGLHFKLPFAQTVYKMDKRLLTGRQTTNVPLAGQQSVDVDYYVKWRIADVATYYRATGGQAQLANDRLMQGLDSSLREVLGKRSLEQLVTGDREPLDDGLLHEAQRVSSDLGIEVSDVRINTLTLPKDVAQAYFDRMRAERKRTADELRARGKEEADQVRAAAAAMPRPPWLRPTARPRPCAARATARPPRSTPASTARTPSSTPSTARSTPTATPSRAGATCWWSSRAASSSSTSTTPARMREGGSNMFAGPGIWLDILRALSLVMVIEGILPFVAPPRSREVFARLATLDDKGLRTIGLLSMLSGLAALQLIHWLA